MFGVIITFLLLLMYVLGTWRGQAKEWWRQQRTFEWLSAMHSEDMFTMSRQNEIILSQTQTIAAQKAHIETLEHHIGFTAIMHSPVSNCIVDGCRPQPYECPKCGGMLITTEGPCITCDFGNPLKSRENRSIES